MFKNYTSLKDDFALDLLLTISKTNKLVFNDEIRTHLKDLLIAGILSLDFIEKYLNDSNQNYNWSWKTVSLSPNLTLEFITKHADKSWDWKVISKNTIITNDFIDKYPDKPYCWSSITTNKSIKITEEFVRKYFRKNLDWKFLSSHPNISFKLIEDLEYTLCGETKRPEWHSWEISRRPDINLNFIYKFKDCNFNWNAIVRNENLPIIDIIELLEITKKTQWGFWYYLSLRDDITEEVIKKYPLKRWNWWWISKHKNIDLGVVLRNPDWNWDWSYLPVNPNITLQQIKEYPNLPWNLKNITSNLTSNMIDTWVVENRIKFISARRIHRFWRDVNYNPLYKKARLNIIANLNVKN